MGRGRVGGQERWFGGFDGFQENDENHQNHQNLQTTFSSILNLITQNTSKVLDNHYRVRHGVLGERAHPVAYSFVGEKIL